MASAQTISQRGVSMVATAHGTNLESVLHNPVLNKLIGGIQSVTIGDYLAEQTAYGPGLICLSYYAGVHWFVQMQESIDIYLSEGGIDEGTSPRVQRSHSVCMSSFHLMRSGKHAAPWQQAWFSRPVCSKSKNCFLPCMTLKGSPSHDNPTHGQNKQNAAGLKIQNEMLPVGRATSNHGCPACSCRCLTC